MSERKIIRKGRATSILSSAVANFLRETLPNDIILTITHSELSKAGTKFYVYYSTFPKERTEEAEKILEKEAHFIKPYLRKTTKLKSVPFIEFIPAPSNELPAEPPTDEEEIS